MKKKAKKDNSLFGYYGFTKKDAKKYPVISGILKQLTPERIKKEIEEIQKVELPPELQKWVKEYEKVGDRDEFLWKWMHRAVQAITFPDIPLKYQRSLWNTKVFIIIFIALLDDVADKMKKTVLLNELLKIPSQQIDIKFNLLNREEKKYLITTINLWNYIEKIINKYPKYEKFREVFEYDILQAINSINYGNLVNKNIFLINKTEYWIFFPYNMQGFVSYDLDLMCSSKFSIQNFATLREIIWKLQKMARISNWITTWEREIKEKDFSSGVIPYALDSKAITINNLKQKNKSQLLRDIKSLKIEKQLLKEWEQLYLDVEKMGKKVKIADRKKILSGLEKFLVLHLIGVGYI